MLLALGIACAGAAFGIFIGIGSTSFARVDVLGVRLEEVSVGAVAGAAAGLAVASALLLLRGFRVIWGRRQEREEPSVQAEALRIRWLLLRSRVDELEDEVARLEHRRDEARSLPPVVSLPDPDAAERSRLRWGSSGEE